MDGGVFKLQAHEEHGVRSDSGLGRALELQRGRKTLFQPQPRFRQPGGIHQ